MDHVEDSYGANGVVALSQNDAWSVGNGIEHWNGDDWKVVPFALPASWFPLFASASAAHANDVWAVGNKYRLNSAYEIVDIRAPVAHWNGAQWTYDPSIPLKSGFSDLGGISTLPNGDAWAEGSYGNAKTKTLRPLIEHYSHC